VYVRTETVRHGGSPGGGRSCGVEQGTGRPRCACATMRSVCGERVRELTCDRRRAPGDRGTPARSSTGQDGDESHVMSPVIVYGFVPVCDSVVDRESARVGGATCGAGQGPLRPAESYRPGEARSRSRESRALSEIGSCLSRRRLAKGRRL
jgi:hypothetical protein